MSKDAMAFGIFFTVFEVGREASRKVGLAWDGIDDGELIEENDWDEDGYKEVEVPTKKRRRSGASLVLQSIGILVSGGVAGLCFALVARPFERARAAIYEGRARWAERDGRLKVIEELALRSDVVESQHKRQRRRMGGKRDGHPRGDSVKRRVVRVQVSRCRGVGRTFVRAKRRNLKAKILAGRSLVHPSSTSSGLVTATRRREPMPSASSLIRLAARRHGVLDFFFAPLPSLHRHSGRFNSSSTPPPSTPIKVGRTRLSARGKQAQEAVRMTGGWRRGAKVLAYSNCSALLVRGGMLIHCSPSVPPYAVGFFAYALMSGDLK